MGFGTPNRRRMRRNKKRENNRPMVKKFAKTKSLSKVRFLVFLGTFDLGFEDGRIDCAQFPPRLVEKAISGFLDLYGKLG
jgi:hypothetical protein